MQDDASDTQLEIRRPHSPLKEYGTASSVVAQKVDNERPHEKEEILVLLKKASPPIECSLPPATFSTLTKLDLPECGLTSLPSALATFLPNLRILFCPKNNFQELPAVIGSCPNLTMVSFKSNCMRWIHRDALQAQLQWLILTDNALEEIPETISKCTRLQKLMLAGNKLQSLPESISSCTRLALVRLASNQFVEPPMALLRLPNLAWVALSDNPFLMDQTNDTVMNDLPILDEIVEGDVLGQGASGVTRRGTYNHDQPVAVKTYMGSMTSDGNPLQERTIALKASQCSSPCLIQVLGQTSNGSLVMELLENFKAFSDPPSLESCTRDVYPSHTNITVKQALAMVSGLLNALVKLHECEISHGDFYGHNILVSMDDPTNIRLSDFGAAFLYHRQAEYGKYVERIELRAFAHLVDEIEMLLQRRTPKVNNTNAIQIMLMELAHACRQESCTFSSLQGLWQTKCQDVAE